MTPEGRGRRFLSYGFVAVVGVALVWGLWDRREEIAQALSALSLPRVALALGLVIVGLLCTSLVWWCFANWVGSSLALRHSWSIFFVGQLGKYVPGSVWTVVAQSELGSRHGLSRRAGAATGVLFLYWHLVTAVVVAAWCGVAGILALDVSPWILAAVGTLSTAAASPWVISRLGRRLAGHALTPFGAARLGFIAAVMAGAWACYAFSLVPLAVDATWADAATLGASFAMAYALGVVVVIAPAGAGVREAAFIALAAPTIGVPQATAVALSARVLHSVADVALAVVSPRDRIGFGTLRRKSKAESGSPASGAAT